MRNLDVVMDYIKPGLAFYDPKQFEFIQLLEDNYAAIREEFLRLEQHAFIQWPETYLCKKGWEVFGLFAFDNKLESNCSICPVTASILEKIPGMTTAMFSCLDPKTHIRPHVGYASYSERILRVHLGVIVPDDCALKVNGQLQTWQEGKCFVFDDSFRHEAWNKSTSRRIVLMIDIWYSDRTHRNPELYDNLEEKDAVISPYLLSALEEFCNPKNCKKANKPQ